jgi:hypothetical protein
MRYLPRGCAKPRKKICHKTRKNPCFPLRGRETIVVEDPEEQDEDSADDEKGGEDDEPPPPSKKARKKPLSPLPPPLPPPSMDSNCLPPGWKMAKDGHNRTYYYSKYNRALNISQYEFPQLSSPQSQSPPLPPPKSASSAAKAQTFSRSSSGVGIELDQQLVEQIASLQAQLMHANREERKEIAGRLAELRIQRARLLDV